MPAEKIIVKKNPIIQGKGVCDPHIHIFKGRVFLFASHDFDRTSSDYIMKDWQIWASADCIEWKLEAVVKPEEFHMGSSNNCWAVDAACKNDKYYFYFSNGNSQTGVAVADEPEGPYRDVLGKPLLDGTLTETMEYDPAVFIDDDGKPYIAFGGPAWAYGEGAGYFIAKLNEDMISLAEKPRRIILNHEGDDKISINKIKGVYYLSFGSYYAISENIYGPYMLVGNTGASADHGSYFEWNNQLFNAFTIFDPTMTYRASGVCYVHVKENKELVVDPVIVEYGVGQYDADWNKIEAEWFMKMDQLEKKENLRHGFDVVCKEQGTLEYPNIYNLKGKKGIVFYAACDCLEGGEIEIIDGNKKSNIMGRCKIPFVKELSWNAYRMFTCELDLSDEKKDICLKMKMNGTGEMRLDYFKFYA